MDWQIALGGVPLLVFAASSFWFGLKGLLQKRPVLVSNRWTHFPLIAMFLFQLIQGIYFFTTRTYQVEFYNLIASVVMPAFLLLLFWFTRKNGFVVHGIRGEDLQNSLGEAAQKIGEATSGNLNEIKLLNSHTSVFVNHSQEMGVANLRGNNPIVFNRLMKAFHLELQNLPTMKLIHWMQIALGFLLFSLLIGMGIHFSQPLK